jgi:Domain of unknown function (DUF222)/HNH endonuclease
MKQHNVAPDSDSDSDSDWDSPEVRYAKLSEGIKDVIETDPSLRCDSESIVFFQRLRSQLDYAISTSAESFDQWGPWLSSGAQTSTAWVDTTCHIPKKEAKAQLRRGRALPGLPLVAEAWAAGDIGAAQVDVFLGLKRPVTEEALCRDEAILVDLARTMKFAEFATAANYWEQHADQDGSDEAAEARKAQRDVYLAPSLNGTFLGKMNLDPIGGSIVYNELKRIEDELFKADWAEAKERLGREPHADELARTPAQRRADALVEMAARSAALPDGARLLEPLFTVVIDYPTLEGLFCQLDPGPVITPGSLVPWMTRANFERIVFAPKKRIECSVTSRFFTGATRRALEVRDRQCQHEYCDLPAEYCEIDHIVPYSEGGLTEQENGQVLCSFHNKQRYERPPPDG